VKRALLLAFVLSSCSESATGARTDAGADAAAFDAGEELRVPVPATGRVHVALRSPPSIVAADGAWDLAFEGAEVYTNSGPSGGGAAAAFGPLDPIVFLENVAPDVPFLAGDRTGGAFLRWYFYEGAPNHALYSRFHVFGVKDGDALYRVQVLGYYGRRDGAPVSALYRIRYGPVGGPTNEATDLDGTATGDGPGECLDLGTGARAFLTATEARASTAWHLCFRRQDIAVNGETGGPRNVGAIDLDADKIATEKLDEVVLRTPESELARFEAVTRATLEGQPFRGDRVVSAFSGLWTQKNVSPLAPSNAAWLVVAADGKTRHLVGFARFEGASGTGPGTVVMRVKAVR